MFARLSIAVAVLAATGPSASPSARPALWVQALPESPAEAALRAAITRGGTPVEMADALRGVSAAHPRTVASGLAQLAAGLRLLEGGRAADALPFLEHPDLRLTPLPDHALFALGRAQESTRNPLAAAQSFLAAAGEGASPLLCPALFYAAEALARAGQPARAEETLERALARCSGEEPRALLALAQFHERAGDRRRAALAYDRLDREYPASPQARVGARSLRALAASLPPVTAEERLARTVTRAEALYEAGRHMEVVTALRVIPPARLTGDVGNRVRLRLGRALLSLGRTREAEPVLRAVRTESPYAAEAAYGLARIRALRTRDPQAYADVVARFPGSIWAEEALFSLATHHTRGIDDDDAIPYYRRLAGEYSSGRYGERAAWRVAWADYRQGRLEDAAQGFEREARLRGGSSPAGLLYWAGRSRARLGQTERARQLLEEVVRRFKHGYHGLRAQEALAALPGSPTPVPPGLVSASPEPVGALGEPARGRIRALLLIDRHDEAADELRALGPIPQAQATLAWVEWTRGRLRPAIVAMKRAYPSYVGEAGDQLGEDVWRILFPLEFADVLAAKAREEGLDPALVAALVLQESSFDADAVSSAGARGLMQVIPPTGRLLARRLGVRYRRAVLHDPGTSLEFGTHYLRQLLDRFDGRIEHALAAYNAGPARVDTWTAARRGLAGEEFIESIPFSETRHYVMTILAGQHHYRRIYSLGGPAPAIAAAGASESR